MPPRMGHRVSDLVFRYEKFTCIDSGVDNGAGAATKRLRLSGVHVGVSALRLTAIDSTIPTPLFPLHCSLVAQEAGKPGSAHGGASRRAGCLHGITG
jgi:hypothetical protein